MNTSHLLSKHLHEVLYGVNWTWSNLQDQLKDVTYIEAQQQISDLNTISMLVFHIFYYFEAQISVFSGGALDSKDKFSFNCPIFENQEAWNDFLKSRFELGDKLVAIIKTFSDEDLAADFADPKYGSRYRNIQGLIEHSHYHLGQISIIKKLIRNTV